MTLSAILSRLRNEPMNPVRSHKPIWAEYWLCQEIYATIREPLFRGRTLEVLTPCWETALLDKSPFPQNKGEWRCGKKRKKTQVEKATRNEATQNRKTHIVYSCSRINSGDLSVFYRRMRNASRRGIVSKRRKAKAMKTLNFASRWDRDTQHRKAVHRALTLKRFMNSGLKD